MGKIYLRHDQENLPDWQEGAKCISPMPETLTVEMCGSMEQSTGGILLPSVVFSYEIDEKLENLETFDPPHTSVCVATTKFDDLSIVSGDKLICVDGDGVCFNGFESGSYVAKNEVRVFGRVTPIGMDIEEFPIEESIVAVQREGKWAATGRNVLILKDPFSETTEGGLLLLGRTQERDSQAVIQDVGDGCVLPLYDPETQELRTLRVGDRVLYHPQSEQIICDSDEYKDQVFVREMSILAVLG